MSATSLAPEYRAWRAAGHVIEYSRTVVDEIRREATEGYCRLPHGGVEVGGILLGLRDQETIRIVTHRPVACEYKMGPSYVFSEVDCAAMAEAIQSAKTDPGLRGLEPVGWYHSHTRQKICLSPADIELYNRFFSEAWQIAMVLRPTSFQITRAGFFFREADGSIRTESSYREFTLPGHTANAESEADSEEPVDEMPALPAVVQAPAVRIETLPVLSQRTLTVVTPKSESPADGRRPWKWYAAFGVLILANVGAGLWWWLGPARQLSLAAADVGGQLQVHWNQRAVRNATSGSLQIVDGGDRTVMELDGAELRSGSLAYRRKSGNVLLRMTVRQPEGVMQEATRFVDPQWRPAPAHKPADILTARQPVVAAVQPVARPAAAPAVSPQPAVKQPAAHSQPAAAESQPEAPRPEVAIQASSPPPTVPSPPALPVAGAHLNTAILPDITVPAAPPTFKATPSKPQGAAPASGTIIWTGHLPKNGMLMLDAGHASTGALSGALPGRPIRIRVYTADADAHSATIYSPDPKYTHRLIETAGPETGNKKLIYTWDPLRAKGVNVVEAPGSQNGWKRAVLHADHNVSALVVEWTAVP